MPKTADEPDSTTAIIELMALRLTLETLIASLEMGGAAGLVDTIGRGLEAAANSGAVIAHGDRDVVTMRDAGERAMEQLAELRERMAQIPGRPTPRQ